MRKEDKNRIVTAEVKCLGPIRDCTRIDELKYEDRAELYTNITKRH
jgi:hypothetical protein